MSEKRRNHSLKKDILLLILSLSLSIILLASAVSLYTIFRMQQQSSQEQLRLVAESAAATVKDFIGHKQEILEQSALISNFANADEEGRKRTLELLISKDHSVRQVVYFDEDGRAAMSSSRFSNLVVEDFKRRIPQEALAATKEGDKYIGSVTIDEMTSEPVIIMAVPVHDLLGDYHGALVAEINLRFMWDVVHSLQVGKSGLAYVVDERGDLLVFEDIGRVLKQEDLGHLKEVHDFTDEPPSYVPHAEVARGITGLKVLTTFEKIGSPKWAVVVELPLREAYSLFFTGLLISLGFIIFSAVAAIIMGSHFSRRISEPIIRLRDAALKLGKGEQMSIRVESKNEIGDLADSFNTMAVDLTTSQEELERNNKRISELLKVKTQFVNQVAHDLRTPLTPMLLLLPQIRDRLKEKLDEDDLKGINIVIDNAQYLSLLVKDTLNIARLDAGKTIFELQEHDAKEVLEEFINGRQLLFKERKTAVKRDIPNEHVRVYADKTRVLEVLDNLVGNALKFMREDADNEIVIRLEHDEEQATISVQDNGIGMNDEAQEHVFDEFFKADPSRHESAGSSGLGLSICKRLIEGQGGRIWVASEGPGKGSTFRFTVPLYRGQRPAKRQSSPARPDDD